MSKQLTWLEIDLARLDGNLAWWRKVLIEGAQGRPVAKFCAVVKADAYGLGAVPIARRLADRGVEMFAVYSPQQAEPLLAAGIQTPILVLMPAHDLTLSPALAVAAQAGRLHLSVHSPEQLANLAALGQKLGCRLPVHLHIDTGMSRSGLSPKCLETALAQLRQGQGLRLAGLCTHMATADGDPDFALAQLQRFEDAARAFDPGLENEIDRHVANTCATLRGGGFLQSMVRVGLGLHGFGPEQLEGLPKVATQGGPLPTVRWLAQVVHRRHYAKGLAVGYGCTHRLTRDSVLGTLPAGYADGYPLSLSNRGAVASLIGPEPDSRVCVPVIGRVNMDQIVVDLTGTWAATADQRVHAELISDDPASACALPQLAALAGSSCYEMLCRLSSRLPRHYIEGHGGAALVAAAVRVAALAEKKDPGLGASEHHMDKSAAGH